jgi:hypothetical protein
VLVVGRRLFDMTDGWGGIHPLDRPVVVMTHRVPEEWVRAHPGAPFTFVTDGTLAAIERAQEIAGDKAVGVNGGIIARRCLELGLLDEISLDLVPVLLGRSWPGTPLMAISCLAHRAGGSIVGTGTGGRYCARRGTPTGRDHGGSPFTSRGPCTPPRGGHGCGGLAVP